MVEVLSKSIGVQNNWKIYRFSSSLFFQKAVLAVYFYGLYSKNIIKLTKQFCSPVFLGRFWLISLCLARNKNSEAEGRGNLKIFLYFYSSNNWDPQSVGSYSFDETWRIRTDDALLLHYIFYTCTKCNERFCKYFLSRRYK